ncbi:MAG: hypothetical protein R3343_13120 [Nitriliruptorales bacterium]|nr:hypothetical protein [Nitriliruptorales bacterium]
MATRTRTDTKLISTLFLVGAALAVLGNGLHPFFAADATAADIVAEASSSSLWLPVHVGIGIALLMLTGGLALLAGALRDTPGRSYAALTAVLAIVGGTIFTFQIAAVDGYAMRAVADLPQGEAAAAAIATLGAIDTGLLSLSVMLFLGLTFVALGETCDKADIFAGWIRWTATIAGILGVIVGLLMLADTATDFTFIAFRVVALATTIVAIGIGVALRKGPEVIDLSTAPSESKTTTPA